MVTGLVGVATQGTKRIRAGGTLIQCLTTTRGAPPPPSPNDPLWTFRGMKPQTLRHYYASWPLALTSILIHITLMISHGPDLIIAAPLFSQEFTSTFGRTIEYYIDMTARN